MFLPNIYIFIPTGPVGINHGNLGPVPAPVARGCHGPPKTLLLAPFRGLRGPATMTLEQGGGGGGKGRGPET